MVFTRSKRWWLSIPIQWRKAFYCLPLFIQWWPALYFEDEKEAFDKALCALGFSLYFLIGITLSYSFYLSTAFFTDSVMLVLYYISFALQLLCGPLYILFSFLCVCEAMNGKFSRFSILAAFISRKIVAVLELLFRTKLLPSLTEEPYYANTEQTPHLNVGRVVE